jgi:hypothetical protein
MYETEKRGMYEENGHDGESEEENLWEGSNSTMASSP